jgi:hypothetical protein
MQLHYCNHFLLPFVARHGGIIATHVGQQFLQIQFSSKETIGNSWLPTCSDVSSAKHAVTGTYVPDHLVKNV